MKTQKESILNEIESYDQDFFNQHVRYLVKLGYQSGNEDYSLEVMNFILQIQDLLATFRIYLDRDETLVNKPDETHCPMCVEKERTIQLSANRIQHLENMLKIQDSNLQTLRDFRDEALKELNLIKGNQLKICK